MSVTICRPTTFLARRVETCPNCECRRRFVVSMTVWYPSIWTCCACGDAYSEGGRMERPFARGWRQEAIAAAKAKWAVATSRQEALDALLAAAKAEADLLPPATPTEENEE